MKISIAQKLISHISKRLLNQLHNAREGYSPRRKDILLVLFSAFVLSACTSNGDSSALPTFPPTIPRNTPLPNPTSTIKPPSTVIPRPTEARQPLILSSIQMFDENNGWGFGDARKQLLTTHDGGSQWDLLDYPGGTDQAHQIATAFFRTRDEAALVILPVELLAIPDEITVLKTSDRGAEWSSSEALPFSGLNDFFIPEYLQFADADQGWLLAHVGAGMSHDYITIYSTEDGGRTWNLAADPAGAPEIQGCQKSGMHFSAQREGWLTADCQGLLPEPLFMYSPDGGLSWEEIPLPAPVDRPNLFQGALCSTHSPHLFDGGVGQLILSCIDPDPGKLTTNFLYRSTDAGISWVSSPIPTPEIIVLDQNLMWAVGETLHLTEDGGKTWLERGEPPWPGNFSFVDNTTGWVLEIINETGTLTQTFDAGQTWQTIHPTLNQN